MTMKKFIELNHILEDGMSAYPGLPRPKIEAYLDHEASRGRYENQAEFYLGKVEMVCNLGTYLDSPFHRYSAGEDLSQIPLERVAGVPGIVLDGIVSRNRSITLSADSSELNQRAVLVRTGWDERWGTESYWEPGPELLVKMGSVYFSSLEWGAGLILLWWTAFKVTMALATKTSPSLRWSNTSDSPTRICPPSRRILDLQTSPWP